MKAYKIYTLFWLVFGILFFLGFAYDIENDRDFMTWIWLLTSILGLMEFVVLRIKDLVSVPQPNEDETWLDAFHSRVDDVLDDGILIVTDTYGESHYVSIDRVTLVK
jgi:hypothetical protein